jgi:hypothetical protein
MFTGEPTNEDRAKWALAAVNAFAKETRMDEAGEELETILGDLFCDLRHLCDFHGLDFDHLASRSRSAYEEERAEREAEERDKRLAPRNVVVRDVPSASCCGRLAASDPFCSAAGRRNAMPFGADQAHSYCHWRLEVAPRG